MSYLLAAAALWFGATGCYVLVIHAKVLREAGRLNLFWTINILPWAIVGLTLDAVFNAVGGTLMFLELPREWLFSSRVKRHFRQSGGWRFRLADWWARQLNAIDPTHITPPKG
jgi:hypothetical protein